MLKGANRYAYTVHMKLSKEALEILKRSAHKVWEKYDDTHGYRTEKQNRNNDVSTDNSDNAYFFIGQFDPRNQQELLFYVLTEDESEARSQAIVFVMEQLKITAEALETLKKTLNK